MGSFFIGIGFLAFIVFIILGIVSAIKKTGKGKKMMLFAAGCFILMAIGGALSPDSKQTIGTTVKEEDKKDKTVDKQNAADEAKKKEEAQKKAEEEAKKKAELEAKKKADAEAKKKAEEKPVFAFTWDEFSKSWGTLVPEMKGAGIDEITETGREKQENNVVVNAKINDYLMLMSDVNPTSNKVKYISIMAEPSSTNMAQNTNILLAFGNLIANSNPSLSKEERGDILMKGLGFNTDDLSKLNSNYTYKNVKYKASNMAGILTVSIQPK
ncbi:hypothetical protein AB7942_29885 [Neobacillus sp. BF23-41]|uniref:hypothetical protein n=1 Tax=Neobacillus sp. BF23-41 TaxID=3240280 RepID=UPI0034E40764